jgi:hypothetical protein
MEPLRFDIFFQSATGHPPYDYQCRLACGAVPQTVGQTSGLPVTGPPAPVPNSASTTPGLSDQDARNAWLSSGTACQSQLINIPTGLSNYRTYHES